MFFLFSSNHTTRYKRNALEMLCYPDGHAFTVRYGHKHVTPLLTKLHTRGDTLLDWNHQFGNLGIAVYAEKPNSNQTGPFRFCPLREVRIVRIRVLGSVYYIDLRLGSFINFGLSDGSSASHLKRWQGYFESIDKGPQPPEARAPESYFVLWKDECGVDYSTTENVPFQAWESTVDLLSRFTSMQRAIFYHVLGFYVPSKLREWDPGPLGEEPIPIEDDGWVTRFPFPMGRIVTLRLIFFRSSKASIGVFPARLSVEIDDSAFAGVSTKKLEVLNRYNEERVELACRRAWDNILAPITIDMVEEGAGQTLNTKGPENRGEEKDIIAPRPFLLGYVKASQGLLWGAAIMIFIGSAALIVPSDVLSWQKAGFGTGIVHELLALLPIQALETIVIFLKALGSALIAAAFFVTLRRFPLPRG